MTYSAKAKQIKADHIKRYKALSNELLHEELQLWLDSENKDQGYLPGLTPQSNVSQLSQMIDECGNCTKPEGHCTIANVLRNMASVEYVLEILEKNNNEDKSKRAMTLLEKSYEPFVMLHEFTTRVCEGTWHNNLIG